MEAFLMKWGAQILIGLVQAATAWVLWSLRKEFVSQKQCSDRRKEMGLACVDNREKMSLACVDNRKGLKQEMSDPLNQTRRELADLGTKIGGMQETLGELKGRISGIGRAVDLMNQYLIGKGNNE